MFLRIGIHSWDGTDGNRFFTSKLTKIQPFGTLTSFNLEISSLEFDILYFGWKSEHWFKTSLRNLVVL